MRKLYIALFVIFIISLIMRFLQIKNGFSLDFDEMYSVWYGQKFTLMDIATGRAYDPGNPPFFFILMKIYNVVFGFGKYTLKIFSFVFLLFSLIIYTKINRGLGLKIVLVSAVVFLFNNVLFFISLYARVYMMLVFFSLLFIYLDNADIKKNKYFYLKTIVAILGLYSHFTFLFFLISYLASSFVLRFLKKISRYDLLSTLNSISISFISFTPWIFIFFSKRTFSQYNFWQFQMEKINVLDFINFFIESGLKSDSPYLVLLWLFFGLLIVKIIFSKSASSIFKKIILTNYICLSIIFFSPLKDIFVVNKYFSFLIPLTITSFFIFIVFFVKNKILSTLLIAIFMVLNILNWEKTLILEKRNHFWDETFEIIKLSSRDDKSYPIYVEGEFNCIFKDSLALYFSSSSNVLLCDDYQENNDSDFIWIIDIHYSNSEKNLNYSNYETTFQRVFYGSHSLYKLEKDAH